MAYSQSYVDALAERLIPFTEQDLAEAKALGQRERGFFTVPESRRERLIQLDISDQVVGTSLAGDVLLTIPGSQVTEERLAEALGCDVKDLELKGQVVRQRIRELRPVLCRRRTHRRWRFEPSLGEGTVQLDLSQLPPDGAIQAVREKRLFVTREGPPEAFWLTYTSKQVMTYAAGNNEVLEPLGFFPPAPLWPLPPGAACHGCDVWSCQAELAVKTKLDEHAEKTKDRPIPRYQMIVDPNQFVTDTAEGPVWVPCEFDVGRSPTAQLVGGRRAHPQPLLAQEVARPVLEAALPLLAQLRRPQLLLDERRLQVVFKAQRIILPAERNGSESEYVGLWHVDGLREHIVAVVLYYYHVDPALEGGDMEFAGREPMDVLGVGDCSNNYARFDRDSMRRALQEHRLAHCRVPIRQGTLLVFSNCQVAHRVLRMANSKPQEASRDFVALFIVDPAQLLRPARSVLSQGYLEMKALFTLLGPSGVRRVQEFLGHWPSRALRRARRDELLAEQLRPSGEFCGGSQVVATGNGCYTMIGWLHHLLEKQDLGMFGDDFKGAKLLKGLNLSPTEQRGMSEVLSMETSELDWR